MAKEEQGLDFDKVAQIFKAEKGSQKLVKLPPGFYKLFDEYLAALKSEVAEMTGSAPDSPKFTMLSDEIKKSSQRMKQIRELRERKISLLAVLKANGGMKKDEDMTPEEEALMKDLVKVVRSYKDVSYKASKPEPERKAEKKPEPQPAQVTEPAGDEQPKPVKPEPQAQPKPEKSQQTIETAARKVLKYKLVQILEDLPQFVGENTTYSLAREDVVSLPTELADLLCGRGKAIEVRVTE